MILRIVANKALPLDRLSEYCQQDLEANQEDGEIAQSKRVERLEENQLPPSKRRVVEPRTTSWADRDVQHFD